MKKFSLVLATLAIALVVGFALVSCATVQEILEDVFYVGGSPGNITEGSGNEQSPNDFEITQNAQGGITITGYTGRTKQVVIPETIEGIKVTEIGPYAFARSRLTFPTAESYYEGIGITSVTLPDGLITIGEGAFIGNDLTSITIPDSVTSIGERAFGWERLANTGGKLKSVAIGSGITSIEKETFYHNELTSITIPDNVTIIGESAFSNNKITTVNIGNGVTSIGRSAFYNNQITSITIPDNITSIGDNAFNGNQITSITIPDSVTSIRINAFGDKLTSITLPANVSYAGSFYNNFDDFYQSQNRKAGTYTWSGRIWRVD